MTSCKGAVALSATMPPNVAPIRLFFTEVPAMPADRQLVSSGVVWEPVVGYSRAVRVGQWVSVAGTTAARADAASVGGADIAERTREAIRRIAGALHEVGADLRHVVRTRMFVTAITRWEEVGRAHGESFATIRPAASMVEVRALIDPQLLVEVEADAIITGGLPAGNRDDRQGQGA